MSVSARMLPMPDELTCRQRERAAYEKGWDARGRQGIIRKGLTECMDAEYPLPPAKVWRCMHCGIDVDERDLEPNEREQQFYHVPGEPPLRGHLCGPVEEVTL